MDSDRFAQVWPLIDSVEGLLVSPTQERWLFEAARSLPGGTHIVEIGSYQGRSTCCLALGCKYGCEPAFGSQKQVYTIDTYNGNGVDFFERDFFDEFMNNVARCGVAPYVTPLQGISSQIARTWNKPIHLLFIDGSHQYEDVLADFYGFFPHLVPGGIVAVHDVIETWPEVKRAWEEGIRQHLIKVGTCHSLSFGLKPDGEVRGAKATRHV